MLRQLCQFAILVACLWNSAWSQNLRQEKNLGLSWQILGPSLLTSVDANCFITPNFNVSAGAGLFGYHGGLRYFWGKATEPTPWAPYFGAFYTNIFDFSMSGSVKGNTQGLYAPVGIQYMRSSGFNISAEVAYIYLHGRDNMPIWGSIQSGYNF